MSFAFKITVAWTIFLGLQKVWHAEKITNSEDENICNTTVRYPVELEVKYNYSYMEPYQTWCTSFPFRCTKHRQKSRIEVKKITEYRNKTVYECCEGYERDEETCKPVCDFPCWKGYCIAPNICACTEGRRGADCMEECEEGKYGKNCIHNCLCKNGAACDKVNGTCKCTSGFTGEYCESPCPGDSFGKYCENSCKCKNGAECDKANGSCECKPGYHGKQCKNKCVVGTFGKDCEDICKCKMDNTDVCSHIDGICFCKPGWRGQYCEKPCDDQTWGPSCLNSCECGKNGSCHRLTGKCLCSPGWEGPKCDQKCPVGYFARDCKMKCPDCLHEPGSCHHETGWCNCPPGSSGPTCDLECPSGTYGNNCENICLCTNNSICDSASGECLCFPGWTGDECQFPCPEGTYGKNCNFSCNCPDRFSCNRFDGNCDCNDTDDDPQCIKGHFLLQYEESHSHTAAILVILGILSMVLLIIVLGIFLIKRKALASDKTFSFCKSFRTFLLRRKIISSNEGDEGITPSNAKHFENPVYEVMDGPFSHGFDNPLAITNEACRLDLDFKIPDCDISTKVKKIEAKNENNLSRTDKTSVEKISFESTSAKYEKKDVDKTNLESSSQNSPVYTEVDLTEHHFEFPSHHMN